MAAASVFAFGVEDSFVSLVIQMAIQIDPKWDIRLKPKLVEVAKMLSPRRNRLPARLFSENLINEDELERFTNSDKLDTDLALDILIVLRKQVEGSFDKFCDVLLEVKDETLNAVEKSLRPNRQTSIESKHLERNQCACLCRGMSDVCECGTKRRDDGFAL